MSEHRLFKLHYIILQTLQKLDVIPILQLSLKKRVFQNKNTLGSQYITNALFILNISGNKCTCSEIGCFSNEKSIGSCITNDGESGEACCLKEKEDRNKKKEEAEEKSSFLIRMLEKLGWPTDT